MNQGKFIFVKLTDFLPRRVFDRIVDKYDGNTQVRSFTCWNQLLCMVFGQLTARDSMRDLTLSLEAYQSKYYHLGFGPTVSRRNLCTANENGNCKIFEEFAYVLISEARRGCYRNDFKIEIDGNVYALDSTTIALCLSVFWCTEFRKHKEGIKLHTLFDIKTSIPSFIHITTARVYDVNIMDIIPYEKGSFYVADKAYTDFNRLRRIRANDSFFVIRANENLQFQRMYSRAVDKTKGVINEQIGRLLGPRSRTEYTEQLRRIKYYDAEHDLDLIFLTNNMDLKAAKIAFLNKKRWEVELFFEWMKQHFKIKSFWGVTLNAVKIQMYCSIIAYCLVALVGYKLKSWAHPLRNLTDPQYLITGQSSYKRDTYEMRLQ